MAFGYNKVLIIGATSGIGRTLADKVVQNGSNLIVAGRRKEKLDEIVQQYGSDKVSAKTFDVMQLEQVRSPMPSEICPQLTCPMKTKIPQFASNIVSENPNLDRIFVNSGIQRPFDFSKPETVDLDICGPHSQSIPSTLEPEVCNSHRIHDAYSSSKHCAT
jgi:short-subunit dehydrogenase involved in D-alanine esterification of teichoic acids